MQQSNDKYVEKIAKDFVAYYRGAINQKNVPTQYELHAAVNFYVHTYEIPHTLEHYMKIIRYVESQITHSQIRGKVVA